MRLLLIATLALSACTYVTNVNVPDGGSKADLDPPPHAEKSRDLSEPTVLSFDMGTPSLDLAHVSAVDLLAMPTDMARSCTPVGDQCSTFGQANSGCCGGNICSAHNVDGGFFGCCIFPQINPSTPQTQPCVTDSDCCQVQSAGTFYRSYCVVGKCCYYDINGYHC